MIKKDEQNVGHINQNSQKYIKFNNKILKESRKIQIIRLIVNSIFSLILIAVFIYILSTYEPQWRILFYLVSWSYLMSLYYLISITIIDFIYIICNNYLSSYNNFIRNFFIRICIPFGLTEFFVYWELVLLGGNFEKIDYKPKDIGEAIFLNGMAQFFLFFDMFTSYHIYKNNRVNDIIILTIILLCYYLLISLSKFLYIFEPYDFLSIADVRQIIGVGIIVYLLLLNGYIVFDLLAFYFFEKDNNTIINSISVNQNHSIKKQILMTTTNENQNFSNEISKGNYY